MTIYELNSNNQGVNVNFVNIDHEDLFEFYLKVIQNGMTQGHFEDVEVDEDQYSVQFTFLDKKFGKVHLALDLFKTSQEGVTVISFRKTRGCMFKY